MKSVHIDQIPWKQNRSPKGAYEVFQKHISVALGGKKDIGTWGGGYPFDLAMVRVPMGCKNWPVHRHSAQWELYYILEGNGRYFDGEDWHEIHGGNAILAPPGENHQIENSGAGDLTYLVIADMPQSDNAVYSATGLIFVKPQRILVQEVAPNYYDGQE